MEEYIELDKTLACMAEECGKEAVPQKNRLTAVIDASELYKKLNKSWNRHKDSNSSVTQIGKIHCEFGPSLRNELDNRVQRNRSNLEDFVLENIDDLNEEDDYELYRKTGMMLKTYNPFDGEDMSAYETDGEKTERLMDSYQLNSVLVMVKNMQETSQFLF